MCFHYLYQINNCYFTDLDADKQHWATADHSANIQRIYVNSDEFLRTRWKVQGYFKVDRGIEE